MRIAVSMPTVTHRAPNRIDAKSRATLVAVPSKASEVPRSAGGDIALPIAISTPSVAA